MKFFCKKGAFFVIFLKSLLYLICRVKGLDNRKISPILRLFLMSFLIKYILWKMLV